MNGASLPSVEELRRRASDKVERLRPVIASGATLVVLEVSGIQRFIFNVPTEKAGLEVKARSFWVALLPKILSWRARLAAGLGPDVEIQVAAGRAVLVVPNDRLADVLGAVGRDAAALRDETADDLSVAFAQHALPIDALAERGERSFEAAYAGLVARELRTATLRRAEAASPDFWTPGPPARHDWVSLGRAIRVSGDRLSTFGVACSSDDSPLPLGVSIKVGTSIAELAGPRLLIQTDGQAPSLAVSPGDELASLPLAGTWIKDDEHGEPLDFDGLAQHAEGDPKLGVLRMDLDSLGGAFHAAAQGKVGAEGLRDRLALSEAVSLACGPLADSVTWAGPRPRDVQWILAGGDDLFLVGAWSEVIEISLALRDAIVPPLTRVVASLAGNPAAAGLDLSGGVVITAPRVPLAHLAEQAEDEVRRAKGERVVRAGIKAKGAISWGGIAMGWKDWAIVVVLGRELGGAIQERQVPRSLLRRLGGIHSLWHRAEDAIERGAVREAASANKRRWLWEYELGRAGRGIGEDGAKLVQRISELALSKVQETEQDAAAWLGVVAEIAHRRTRVGGEERG